MKIVHIESYLVKLPYTTGGSSNWGDMDWSTLDYVLIRIDTDEHVSGWGDAFGYGAAMATKAAVDYLIKPLLIGQDPTNIRGISHQLQLKNHLWGRYGVTMFAISGIDIALWDIAGKIAGLPLYQLLGGARRKKIPAYASLFKYNDPELVYERVGAALNDGFSKVKLHETEEPEVRAARESAGENIPLMVDTNCPWTPHQAVENALKLKPYDLYWLEEPVFPPEDFESLSHLRIETDIPLAAGENACTSFEFQKMIEADAVNYLQPSVTKVGGITEFLKIIALAEAQGLTIMPHAPYFGPGLLASLHLLSLLPDESLAEYFYYKTIEATFYGSATQHSNGIMTVPEGPGLGIEPDLDVIREFSVND